MWISTVDGPILQLSRLTYRYPSHRSRARCQVEVHCPAGRVHPNEKIDAKWADDGGTVRVEMLEAALNGDTVMAGVFAHGLRMEWARIWRDPCDDVGR